MPKYDRELIARMLSCYDGGGYTDQAVAEQIRLLREAENLEVDAKTVVREVPDGMVLVPSEPTDAMVEVICDRHAGKSVWPDDYGHSAQAIRRRQARDGYRAMLSAASDHQQNAAQGGGEK